MSQKLTIPSGIDPNAIIDAPRSRTRQAIIDEDEEVPTKSTVSNQRSRRSLSVERTESSEENYISTKSENVNLSNIRNNSDDEKSTKRDTKRSEKKEQKQAKQAFRTSPVKTTNSHPKLK